jgi:apolipoprotein N-acyltransferase
MGVAICFEDTDSAQLRRLAEMGAKVLVLITNDSWFSDSSEAEAHAAQAVMRAVETGLPVVRVGNSGVTGVIRPDGTANWLLDSSGRLLVDERGVMVETVSVKMGE